MWSASYVRRPHTAPPQVSATLQPAQVAPLQSTALGTRTASHLLSVFCCRSCEILTVFMKIPQLLHTAGGDTAQLIPLVPKICIFPESPVFFYLSDKPLHIPALWPRVRTLDSLAASASPSQRESLAPMRTAEQDRGLQTSRSQWGS